MKLRKKDKVKVITGKYKGKESVIEKVLTKKNEVYLTDINIVKKAEKGKGIIEIMKSVKVSNIMFVCPKCSSPTRIGIRIEGKKKYRFCKKCQKNI